MSIYVFFYFSPPTNTYQIFDVLRRLHVSCCRDFTEYKVFRRLDKSNPISLGRILYTISHELTDQPVESTSRSTSNDYFQTVSFRIFMGVYIYIVKYYM